MTGQKDIVSTVQDFIEKDRDFVINLTRDMVRVPSVNPKFELGDGLNREGDVQALLEPILQQEGFATEQFDALPGRPNLIGDKPGSEERSLILCGHIDVVPTGSLKDWTCLLYTSPSPRDS